MLTPNSSLGYYDGERSDYDGGGDSDGGGDGDGDGDGEGVHYRCAMFRQHVTGCKAHLGRQEAGKRKHKSTNYTSWMLAEVSTGVRLQQRCRR